MEYKTPDRIEAAYYIYCGHRFLEQRVEKNITKFVFELTEEFAYSIKYYYLNDAVPVRLLAPHIEYMQKITEEAAF